ncbi:MAG: winged helix-turn-helix transcriptional regulator [Hamadaea sp.]|uniref:ArsR/SmtB family transcription factor n=1 Tax=Hamadaea sp. TaxID=2024425 RepID=UPI0017E5B856|nr:winged helix-turn-helix domain-containing protein [Hamadaea sp.]NUR71745.1 winged helix-turn-helix transcriptional regulator [Hamadaea sp.]NUT19059.1 winged helix-turn-helix transcriptional regulator [Hamadaea sp.]
MTTPDLAGFASLLADRTRAGFCLALLDGRAWTVSELARQGGVAASTATEHVHRLVAGGLLVEQRQGRHRYVRLRDTDTAALIEAMAQAAPKIRVPVRGLADDRRGQALAYARTCYDHLAGALGVTIARAMTRHEFVTWTDGPALTDRGSDWLAELGVVLPAPSRRPPLRGCLDWTERVEHLGGAIGAALCAQAKADGWVTPIGTGRALALTSRGRAVLEPWDAVP